MIATLTQQQPQAHITMKAATAMRHSNSAGAPLPIIPRRASSTPSSSRIQAPPVISIQSASPDATSKHGGYYRPKHSNQSNELISVHPFPSPSLATPTEAGAAKPSPKPYVPGTFTLTIANLKKAASESTVPTSLQIATKSTPSVSEPTRPSGIRKKSGELVKPSLKSSKSAPRTSVLTVFTDPPNGEASTSYSTFASTVSTTAATLFQSSSKSEPTTPSTAKTVHFGFGKELEQVKLFLAEQRPIAVSRDGSPTDDWDYTSGEDTEREWPKEIFGRTASSAEERLEMQVLNLPSFIGKDADVALVEMKLGSPSPSTDGSPSTNATTVVGQVRVKNIAYEKSVGVRFTLDDWQTTSEVSGRYLYSINPLYDIFGFTVKLEGVHAKTMDASGKTMIVAIRYMHGGKTEVWDNNGGRNYVAKLSKVKVPGLPLPQAPVPAPVASAYNGRTDMADLRNRLEKVMNRNVGGPIVNEVGSSSSASSALEQPSQRGSSGRSSSLAARYEWSAAAKQQSFVDFPNSNGRHWRAQSHPALSPASQSTLKTPVKQIKQITPIATLGSPRDLMDGPTMPHRHHHREDSEDEKLAFLNETPVKLKRDQHTRGYGYFDIGFVAGSSSGGSLKITQPSVAAASGPFVLRSKKNLGGSRSLDDYDLQSTTTTTPTSGNLSGLDDILDGGIGMQRKSVSESSSPADGASRSPPTSYSDLIDKFCFYTGNGILSISPPTSADSRNEPSSSSSDDCKLPPQAENSDNEVLTPTMTTPTRISTASNAKVDEMEKIDD